MRNPLRIVTAIFAAVALSTSCNDTPLDEFAGATAEVTPQSGALVAIGDTIRLGILVTNGPSVANSAAAWASLDAGIATVDANGLVTAVSVGTARIVVSVPNRPQLADTATITVSQVVASVDISLSGSTTPVSAPIAVTALNDTVRLAAAARDSRSGLIAGAAITWSSLTPSLAGVTPAGFAIAMGNGAALVVAKSGSRADTITLQIQQTAATVDIRRLGSVDPVVGVISVGALADTVRFDAVVRDRRANVISGGTITWSTLDPTIVTVSNGTAVSVANGNGRVVALSGTSADTVVVQITQVGTSLALTPATRTFTSFQDTATLAAVVRDANGRTVTGGAITWRSLTPTVASVSATGRVTALSNGTALITADGPGVSATALITVAQAANRVVVAPSTLALNVGTQGTLVGNSFDANNNAVVGGTSWTSSNPAVATVGPTGVVTGVTVGTANITFRNGTATAVSVVTVSAPQITSITVTPNPVSLNLETSLQLNAAVRDAQGNTVVTPVIWTTSDAGIVLVAADGRVTGNGYGTATVTATLGGIASPVTVNVTPAVARITIAPAPANLFNGDVFDLVATFLDVRDGVVAPTGPVTWTTTTALIATVTAAGRVTVVTSGTANATVTNAGITSGITFITRERVSSIFVEPDAVSVLVGDVATVVATTLDRFGALLTGRAVTWVSSAPGIASVDATGRITAVAVGTANITVSSEGASTIIPVTVSVIAPPPPPPPVTLFAGVAAASPAGTTSINLTASTATGGTPGYTYQWYRGLASGFATNGASLIPGATTLAFTDTGLLQGTPYFYKLIVTDNAAVSVTYAEVNATPGNFNADAGPNQPVGFKRIFVLDGTTTNPSVANPGFTSLGGVQVSAAWNINGGPITATSRIESVDAVGATDGKAFRHWLLAGDNSNFHGAIFANNIANYTPPGWTTPIGTPRSYYLRVRLRFSANFQDHPGRFKPLGYLGSAGGGGASDYYVTQKLDDPNLNNRTGLSRQNTGDGGGTTFRTVSTTSPIALRDTWYDVELLITSQSTLGANDGSVTMWINGAMLLTQGGLHTTPGMNGFEMPMFWGGSGATVLNNMFTDYDVYYLSGSSN